MDSESIKLRANALKVASGLSWKRQFIEARSTVNTVRWVQIALKDNYLDLFSEMNKVLMSSQLFSAIESWTEGIKWGVTDSWEMIPGTTVSIDRNMATFTAYAQPKGLKSSMFSTQQQVTAVLFYCSMDEFIQSSRYSGACQAYDVIHVNPDEHGLDRNSYRHSTIESMISDQENYFISTVNTYLVKSGQPVLRLQNI